MLKDACHEKTKMCIELPMSNGEGLWSRSRSWPPPLAFIYKAEDERIKNDCRRKVMSRNGNNRNFYTRQVMSESKWTTAGGMMPMCRYGQRCWDNDNKATSIRCCRVSEGWTRPMSPAVIWSHALLFCNARMEPSKWTGIPCVDSKGVVVRVD